MTCEQKDDVFALGISVVHWGEGRLTEYYRLKAGDPPRLLAQCQDGALVFQGVVAGEDRRAIEDHARAECVG